MSGAFYPRLAASNIRKNSRTFLPYLITCIFTVAMYYIMKSLSVNAGLKETYGGSIAIDILKFGNYVIAVFAFIFLFYTNSFLTKNRKKEFGLFNILGMEKRHIVRMIGWESLYSAVISFAGGIGLGILLDKLMYVVISRIMGLEIRLGFYISGTAIKSTLAIFGILFFLIFLNSLRMIHLAKPIELLKGGNIGEKEPKAKWLAAILGTACLGGGYYIAVTTENPIMALTLFFLAVLLVIAGTYLLFTAGSIVFLKILKSKKSFYYKTNHFISVSGMMYRMKQNAVGLANICILSTMVLVMLSTTSSLMAGIEDILRERYPFQYEFLLINGSPEQLSELITAVDDIAAKKNVNITDSHYYSYVNFEMINSGNDFRGPEESELTSLNDVYDVFVITAEDYYICTGKKADISGNEVFIWLNSGDFGYESFTLMGREFSVKERTEEFVDHVAMNKEIVPTFGIVVKDYQELEEIYRMQQEVYGKNASVIRNYYLFDTDLDEETQITFRKNAMDNLSEYGIEDYMASSRSAQREGLYELYGSMFFLGIFLGLLFTVATVLIIYYKQISEGIDDKSRFEIMQKVGMSEREVKSSIRSQVLMVFFMPLVMSGIHMVFAFPILRRIMLMLQLTNTSLFVICSVCCFLAFAIIYGAIYLLTARVYYKIVR